MRKGDEKEINLDSFIFIFATWDPYIYNQTIISLSLTNNDSFWNISEKRLAAIKINVEVRRFSVIFWNESLFVKGSDLSHLIYIKQNFINHVLLNYHKNSITSCDLMIRLALIQITISYQN